MKLPNGFGSITKLSGNRRRPFIARKTIGYSATGAPIQTAVGYYASYLDALMALEKLLTRNGNMGEVRLLAIGV